MSDEDKQGQTNEATDTGAKEDAQANTSNDNSQPQYTQAEFDRAVTAASQKIEAKLNERLELEKAEEERKRLEEAGKHEELYSQTRTELEKLREDNKRKEFELSARRLLNEKGLGDHADVLMDGINDTTVLLNRADRFIDSVNKAVELGVQKRLDTGTKKVPTNTATNSTTLKDMTAEQWAEHKKARGLSR